MKVLLVIVLEPNSQNSVHVAAQISLLLLTVAAHYWLLPHIHTRYAQFRSSVLFLSFSISRSPSCLLRPNYITNGFAQNYFFASRFSLLLHQLLANGLRGGIITSGQSHQMKFLCKLCTCTADATVVRTFACIALSRCAKNLYESHYASFITFVRWIWIHRTCFGRLRRCCCLSSTTYLVCACSRNMHGTSYELHQSSMSSCNLLAIMLN